MLRTESILDPGLLRRTVVEAEVGGKPHLRPQLTASYIFAATTGHCLPPCGGGVVAAPEGDDGGWREGVRGRGTGLHEGSWLAVLVLPPAPWQQVLALRTRKHARAHMHTNDTREHGHVPLDTTNLPLSLSLSRARSLFRSR